MNDPSNLQSGTHVAFHIATTECLTRMGARSVVPALANLLLGPCRLDAETHMQMQAAWWNALDKWDRLYAPDIRWEPPVVVWVSASPLERVNLWRTCSWLDHLGLSHRDVLVLDFERRQSADYDLNAYGYFDRVSDHSEEVLLTRLAEARAWPRARYQHAVSLWHQYVDADPSRFSRTCARGMAGFPELATVWTLLSSFFPLRTADGVLHLSRYDELLLKRLSSKAWSTPVTIYADGPDAWLELGFCTGDLFTPLRLNHWVGHGSDPAVERAPGPRGPDHLMLSHVYRLTKQGKRLRTKLSELVDAPRLPVAGAEAYAPEAPWVLLDDGRLVWG
jgi:hypothetical protein